MRYQIIRFIQETGQLEILVDGLAPFAIDLPIDENGNAPEGDELKAFINQFIPVWHFERMDKLSRGIKNAAAISSLVEEIPPPAVTPEDLASTTRLERDRLLRESDWTQVVDAPLAPEAVAAFAAYRQQLRDVPEQPGFPASIVWPISPSAEPR